MAPPGLRNVHQGGFIVSVHLCVAFGQKGHVHAVGGLRRAAIVRSLDPELGEGAPIADALVLARIQHAANAQRGQNGVVKSRGFVERLVPSQTWDRAEEGVVMAGFLELKG